MDYFYGIMGLLGGLGAFLFGFKVLSDSIEKMTNDKLRGWFSKTSGTSRLAGAGIGLVTTALVQSSSATTVMTVGFVNAGVMSLSMATAIIMGANIGTTITAQIVALQSFNFIQIALSLAFFGVFMNMLSKNDKIKTIGNILGGLGLVFVGLEFMQSSMSIFNQSEQFRQALETISNPFILLAIGTGLTALLQSSSAVTSIVITAVATGTIIGTGGNCPLFLILGSNIGTCVTAIISSIGANTNAKRAALIHLMFNVFGTLIFTILLLCIPSFMDSTFAAWFPTPSMQLAMFHTFFNVVCVTLFLPFSNVFVKIARILIKDKKADSEQKSITFIDDRLLATPTIAVAQARKETARMAELSTVLLHKALEAFFNKRVENEVSIREEITRITFIGKIITEFLVKLSGCDLSYKDDRVLSCLHESLADIERIADLADNMTKYTRHYVNDKLEFSDTVIQDIKDMDEKISELFAQSMLSFKDDNIATIANAEQLESDIDRQKKHIIDGHIKRLNEGTCQPQSSGVLINLVGNLERAADHLLNLAHTFEKIS